MRSKNIIFDEVDFLDGFWKNRYILNSETSIYAVKKVFEDSGRFNAVRFLKGNKNIHVYYDSDVAKWIEAVAYLIGKNGEKYKDLELFCDELIDRMLENQREDGYFNSYFQQLAPDKVFTIRNDHELYCAGHIIEAAIAYDKYVKKGKLLGLAERYVAFIRKVFMIEKTATYITCGHEEIELALFSLYEYTGNEKYKELGEYFIDQRGNNEIDKNQPIHTLTAAQDNLPARDLVKAEGHAVRAVYYYSGMADYVRLTGDGALYDACCKLYEDISERKNYITGGIGSTRLMESFTVSYDLPSLTAYTESCAAIGLIFFASRMNMLDIDGKYGDLIERILYNGFLSATSLDGKSFFYENPLEICRKEKDKQTAAKPEIRPVLPIWKRKEVFDCSCCPPNINRFVASMGNLIYSQTDDGIYINQFISSVLRKNELVLETNYPNNNVINISSDNYRFKKIFVRVPQWSNGFSLKLNGKAVSANVKNGYAEVSVDHKFSLQYIIDFSPVFIESNPQVRENAGKVCLMNGPVVYCLEEIDNGPDLFALYVESNNKILKKEFNPTFGLYTFTCNGERKIVDKDNSLYAKSYPREEVILKFIPYFAFANRGESDMLVWCNAK